MKRELSFLIMFCAGLVLGSLIHSAPESPLRADVKIAHMCGEISGLNKALANFGQKPADLPKGCEVFK